MAYTHRSHAAVRSCPKRRRLSVSQTIPRLLWYARRTSSTRSGFSSRWSNAARRRRSVWGVRHGTIAPFAMPSRSRLKVAPFLSFTSTPLRRASWNRSAASWGAYPRRPTAELYNLNVYGRGGHFVPHKDTPRGSDMLGTLVACLRRSSRMERSSSSTMASFRPTTGVRRSANRTSRRASTGLHSRQRRSPDRAGMGRSAPDIDLPDPARRHRNRAQCRARPRPRNAEHTCAAKTSCLTG